MKAPTRIKAWLRPLVFRGRRALQACSRVLRPPLAWDGRHHPALLRFEPWQGESDGTHAFDFLGVKTDPRFRAQFKPHPAGPVQTTYPAPHSAYFELAFVLESVLAPTDSDYFRMMELGAGYGPWLVIAHRAVEETSTRRVQLTGVEMVPHHYRFMIEHLRNNGIDPDEHRLIHAAVSDQAGSAWFRPEPVAELDYGQRVTRRRTDSSPPPDAALEPGGLSGNDGLAPVQVPCRSLNDLLDEVAPLDLLHLDVQGEEQRALTPALSRLNDGVRRLIVATHSRKIHRDLRGMMRGAGWTTVWDFGVRARERTPYGDVQFLDGLLALVNPRLGRRARRGP